MTTNNFINNAWYVAGWDREITTEPRARTLLNQPVVLYRTPGRQAGRARRPLLSPPLSRSRLANASATPFNVAITGCASIPPATASKFPGRR